MKDNQTLKFIPAKTLFKLAGDLSGNDLDAYDGDLPAWLVTAKKRLKFEKMATYAARNGIDHLLMDVPLVPVAQLIEQGFAVRELIRKDALLKSLELAAESAENRATASAGNFIFENPDFTLKISDNFIHRNILYSLVHFLWDQGDLTESTSTHDFEENLKEYSNASEDLILTNRFLLKSIVDDFKSIKMAQSQAEAIKNDLAELPSGRNRAWIIRWAHANWTSKPKNSFSPQLLNWYSSNWPDLVNYVNETMHNAANKGRSACAFIISMDYGKLFFEDLDDYNNLIEIKPFPWLLLWQEFIISGFAVLAAVFRDDQDITSHFSQVIDATYDFDLDRHDKLVIHVGWGGF